LGTEDKDDSRKDEDYESSSRRVKHFTNTLEKISVLPKLSADPRPTASRRSHRRAQKAAVLTSSPYKRTLGHSKGKGIKTIQMMRTPAGFASCVAGAVKSPHSLR
jgi:hypothetical protein